jgi:hypothetical protein
MKCKHENADHLRPSDVLLVRGKFAGVAQCEQFRYLDCGAWLSLGPASDVGCFVEIEAARIVAGLLSCNNIATIEWDTAIGAAAHDADNDPPDDGASVLFWHIGWLTRAIHSHRETP